MDIFEMLIKDHGQVKILFKEYEASSKEDVPIRKKLAETIFNELEVHSQVEEEIFYPALEAEADEEDQKLVREAYEDHRLVKEMIESMREPDLDKEVFEAKFKVLKENVLHHIEEEEGELFPIARKALKGELEEISEEAEGRKEDLMATGL